MSVRARNTSGILERVAGYNDTDLVLSATSKNPIANKTVYAALQQKIEKTVNDLVNYYTTSDTYNKAEVRQLIGAINTLTIEVVATLPTSEISTTTIYFVGPATGTNTYDEYVYVNNAWVKIGDTNIDLSQYVTNDSLTTTLQGYYTKVAVDAMLDNFYTKTEVDTALNAKQNTLTFDTAPTAGSTNPVTSAGIKSAIDAVTLTPVDSIIDGNMNPVTSNAVYDAVQFGGKKITQTHVKLNTDGTYVTVCSYSEFTGNYIGLLYELSSAGRVVCDIPKLMFNMSASVITRFPIYVNLNYYGILLIRHSSGNLEAAFQYLSEQQHDCYIWAYTHN